MAASDVRSQLRARPDVPNEDIDDILDIAARRQDEARTERRGATRAELEAVAKELDIDAGYVDAAIGELKARRAAEAKAEADRAAGKVRVRNGVLAGLAGLFLMGTLAVGGVTGAAWLGAGSVRDAAAATTAAEQRVEAVLDRQATLAPQLAALAGAPDPELSAMAAGIHSATTLAERVERVDALSLRMATQLGALPPPTNEAETTLRLQLHDEIAGAQNRVTVEMRRYHEAEAAWARAADGGLGGLAVTFGFAEGPG